jgi:hypothetical protein
MKITDQPGRLFAVIVFAPLLICKGFGYNDIILIILGILIFIYDLFWLIYYPSKKIII